MRCNKLVCCSPLPTRDLTNEQIIDSGLLAKDQKTMFVAALLRLSIRSSLYPSCLVLKGVEREPFACANGTFGDVYKGKFQDRPVCIKVVKIYKNSQIDHALKVGIPRKKMLGSFS